MQKTLQTQFVPYDLVGTRDALFHLLRTPRGEAIDQAPQPSLQPRDNVPQKPKGPVEHAHGPIVQTDDFIFRD